MHLLCDLRLHLSQQICRVCVLHALLLEPPLQIQLHTKERGLSCFGHGKTSWANCGSGIVAQTPQGATTRVAARPHEMSSHCNRVQPDSPASVSIARDTARADHPSHRTPPAARARKARTKRMEDGPSLPATASCCAWPAPRAARTVRGPPAVDAPAGRTCSPDTIDG